MKKKLIYLAICLTAIVLIGISGPRAGQTTIEPDQTLNKTFVNVNIEFLQSDDPYVTKWAVTVGDNPPDTFSVFKGYLLDMGGGCVQWNPGDSTKNSSVDILFPREQGKLFKK